MAGDWRCLRGMQTGSETAGGNANQSGGVDPQKEAAYWREQVPNNRTRKTGLTTSSSTRIRPGTILSSNIQDRTSTMSKTTSRSVTSRRNPVQHCHGIRSFLQSMRSGTDSAASSVRVIPAVVFASGSKGKEEVRRKK